MKNHTLQLLIATVVFGPLPALAQSYRQYDLFPLTLGSSWTYDTGGSAMVSRVVDNAGVRSVVITNKDNSGNGRGYLRLVADATAVRVWDGSQPNYIMHCWGFCHDPLIKIPLSLGRQWRGSIDSNDYLIHYTATVTSTNVTVTIRNNSYPHCVELNVDVSYPNGYTPGNPRWVNRKFYFLPGVGCIKRIRTSNEDYSETIQAIAWDIKDPTPPTLAITNLVNNQQWGYSSVPIKGRAKDDIQLTKVQYRMGSGAWIEASGTTAWSGNIDGLLPGRTNILSAYAQDAAGNYSLTSVVKVVYNQFLPVNGTYNGLFSANELVSDRAHESSGFLKLTVSGKGSYSGSFVLAGKTNSLGTGQFDVDGHASKNVGTGANLMAVHLDLSLLPGSDTLTGTLSNSAWVAQLRADRAVFVTTNKAPYAGKYTLVFPGAADEGDTTTPLGVGYGAVTMDSLGKVALSGSLADGTALSQGTGVSKDGWWPLYASLNGGKGSIWGWLQFTNPPLDLLGGEVSWIKQLQPTTTKYYRLGFTNALGTQGSLYMAPSNATTHVIAVTNGVVSFVGGYPGVAFANPVLLTNKSVVVDQSKTNKLTMTMGLANGTFSGTVLVPGINKTRTFKGAVLQNENVGVGYILGTNLSGRVEFQGR